jgi:hypothetical protein
LLESEHRYVRLATLDQIRAAGFNVDTRQELTDTLLRMLEDDSEWCPIRGRTSQILGEWQIQAATEGTIEAMELCDDESRYWMLMGLKSLSKTDPIAMGAIQALTYDTDIFIRTEASTWLEAR